MKREFYTRPRSDDEVIALFGQAHIVKTVAGKLEVRGGTPDEQAKAREWQETFLTDASKKKAHQR